jgi:hypothetical protein
LALDEPRPHCLAQLTYEPAPLPRPTGCLVPMSASTPAARDWLQPQRSGLLAATKSLRCRGIRRCTLPLSSVARVPVQLATDDSCVARHFGTSRARDPRSLLLGHRVACAHRLTCPPSKAETARVTADSSCLSDQSAAALCGQRVPPARRRHPPVGDRSFIGHGRGRGTRLVTEAGSTLGFRQRLIHSDRP